MSNFADYYKERQGAQTIEVEHGFIVFSLREHDCFLAEIYVEPALRTNRLGTDLFMEMTALAREAGCKVITATIFPATKGATEALHAALHVGMRVQGAQPGVIHLVKEIN